MKLNQSLSFNDILMEPRFSTISSRKQISLKTKLTKNISLNLPLISSPMDTLTNDKMAIAMATNGGLGIIHRYNTIEEQCNMIKSVKRYLSFVIESPYTVNKSIMISHLKLLINKLNVWSYLVIDNDNKLYGIITKRDIESYNLKNKFDDSIDSYELVENHMTPLEKIIYINNNDVTRSNAIEIMSTNKIEKLPIIDENKNIVGLITFNSLYDYEKNKHNYTLDKNGKLQVGAAVGIIGDYLDRAISLYNAGCDILCVDVANGYNENVKNAISKIKENIPEIDIMAGNVCNANGYEFLCKLGVDCIRIGIGCGSICTTRLVTGCGKGQFSAIMECRNIARKYGVSMISDGGHCGSDGNIAKALIAGCDAMMLGNTLSATDETPGTIIYRNGKRVKYYRGMASVSAMISKGEMTNNDNIDYLGHSQSSEGVVMEVEVKGPVRDILIRISNSLKSSMSYQGFATIKELRDNENDIEFCMQTPIGLQETTTRGKLV